MEMIKNKKICKNCIYCEQINAINWYSGNHKQGDWYCERLASCGSHINTTTLTRFYAGENDIFIMPRDINFL